MTYRTVADRDAQVRAGLDEARVIINRTPHLSPSTRKEANRALEALDRQLGLNRVNAPEAAGALELLNRAHPSILFRLLRSEPFVERFAAPLRQLGLRGITSRLNEVPGSVMADPIPGPIGGRRHRDELAPRERVDADGNPLPLPPGHS